MMTRKNALSLFLAATMLVAMVIAPVLIVNTQINLTITSAHEGPSFVTAGSAASAVFPASACEGCSGGGCGGG